VILDEKRNLIVAGAGTGKTTTILAKVLYLIKSKKCMEEEILLLAFTKPAKAEMEQRLEKKSLSKVKVSTIHALGREIIGQVNGKPPKVTTELSSENDKLNAFITKLTNQLDQNSSLHSDLAKYFSEYLVPFKPESDFKNGDEYLSWKRMNSLVTLNNDWVKSYGELKIGNFLYVNGISHLYEDDYKAMHGRFNDFYRPDFFIVDKAVYIEYFGIDLDGNTSPWIDNKKYHSEIKWKRNIHKEYGTNLIEITYQDLIDDVWQKKLIKQLSDLDINLKPISNSDIVERAKIINDSRIFNRFSKLVSQFLTLFKSKSLDINKLIEDNRNNSRNNTFLRIFNYIFIEYEKVLKEKDSIDFMDMLNQSSNFIKESQYRPEWKYIIVDEFQDTSFAQYDFINNILAVNEDTKLFCVGDDWQSIFAFSGADYHYMTDYKEYFGVANFWSKVTGKKQEATLISLDETFRFNNMISHTTGEFIQKNPAQIKKELKSPNHLLTTNESVIIHWSHGGNEKMITQWLDTYSRDKFFKNKNLLILARYNFEYKNLSKQFRDFISDQWSLNGKVSFNSCHSSKGKEEDIVLIINLTADFLGFPSNVIDDPILELVKTVNDEEYLHAEERRLMYVAMTRARHQTHILCDLIKPSVFGLELSALEYKTKVYKNNSGLVSCPKCKKGFVINKTKNSNKKAFYQCTRAEVCDYVAASCMCGNLLLRDKNDKIECENKKCKEKYIACGKCDFGILVKRESKNNKFTPFFSCHTFPKCKKSSPHLPT
jgi:DNA helicase IV